jgi:diadenosine tetraphosphatase ApaH/serine/threonine PP2A family protein phosphatase
LLRIAFISDIHANLQALEAVLAVIDAEGADRLVCLGDIVGYGADPQACVELIAERARGGAIVVKGNHDAAVANGVAGMSRHAASAITWTVEQLDGAARAFLADLPLAEAEDDRLYVHASPAEPLSWPYILETADAFAAFSATEARLTFVGHSHLPVLFHTLAGALYTGKTLSFRPDGEAEVPLAAIRRYIAVLPSVGQPRDGNPAAGWGLYDSGSETFAWRRVGYDVATAQERIRAAGLPDRLWMRLELGR